MTKLLNQKKQAFAAGRALAKSGEKAEVAAAVALGMGRLEGDFISGFESI